MVYIHSCTHTFKMEKTHSSASDLALDAAKQSIASVDVSCIDAIICATVTKDYIYPSTACILSGKLGIKNAFCFDIESDFTGFISGLRLGYAFVESGRYNNVLVVASESLGMFDDKNNFTDGAASALLSNNVCNLTLDFIDCQTDGSALTNCYVKMGGSANPYTKEGIELKEHFISLGNNSVFAQAAESAGIYVKKTLQANNIVPTRYIPSYSGVEAHEIFISAVDVPKDKVYSEMSKYASSMGASAGVAFSMALQDGFIGACDKIALCAYGSGYTKALAVFSS